VIPGVLSMVGFDERSPGPGVQRQFPEPWVVMIIDFGSTLRVKLRGEASSSRHVGGFVAGLGDAFALVERSGRQRGVQVDLTPTAARRLFGVPVSELANRIVALTDLLPAEHRSLADRLDAAPSWPERLDLVEALLARRILDAPVDTARVDWALGRIQSAGGRLALGALAREIGCSHKHLIALFRDQVGVNPKLYARLVRFERTMRAARAGAASWAELALEHGYSDQAHLAREVAHFTGLTPTAACRTR
jgi:AraC-like DNA-binding protein